jgi:hypothetical protein
LIYDSIVLNSTIVNSIINQSEIYNSGIYFSNITLSFVNDSQIWYSNVFNSTIIKSFVNSSNIDNSYILNSTIIESNISWSTIINSTIIGSNLNYTYVVNSYIYNTTLFNVSVFDANITSGVIYNGTIIFGCVGPYCVSSNTTYNATIDGPANLTDLINYAPTARLSVASPAYANDFVLVDASATTDPNVPGKLNDYLVYNYTFGDGTSYFGTSNRVSHDYSSVGDYTILLTVRDRYGLSSRAEANITIVPDTNPPKITILSPQSIAYTTQYVSFTVSLSERGEVCEYSLNSGAKTSMPRFNESTFDILSPQLSSGNYNVEFSCNDSLGNANSTSIGFSVSLPTTPPSGGPGGGGGITPGQSSVFGWDGSQFEKSFLITDKDIIKFIFRGKTYYLRASDFTDKSIIVRITPVMMQELLNIGDKKKFDLDREGYYDLAVTLNSLSNGKANVSLRMIQELIVNKTTGAGTGTTDDGAGTGGEELKEGVNPWVVVAWAVAGLIILGVIVWLVIRVVAVSKTRPAYSRTEKPAVRNEKPVVEAKPKKKKL